MSNANGITANIRVRDFVSSAVSMADYTRDESVTIRYWSKFDTVAIMVSNHDGTRSIVRAFNTTLIEEAIYPGVFLEEVARLFTSVRDETDGAGSVDGGTPTSKCDFCGHVMSADEPIIEDYGDKSCPRCHVNIVSVQVAKDL